MAEINEPSKLPRRDAVVEQVHDLVRNGLSPAVFVVEIAGFDALSASDVDGAHDAVREVESRLDRVVRGRDVLGFEPPARFIFGCSSLPVDAAGAVLERIRGGAAFPVEVGGDAVSLSLDIGMAFFADGATGASLVEAAETDLGRAGSNA
jgi:GGDEF domain-containing protein